MLESKVAEMLGQLSDKLGVASVKIWEWSLLQVKVEIVTTVILLIIAIGVSFGAFKYFKWLYATWDNISSNNEFNHIMLCIALGVILVILDAWAIISVLELPKLIINPEYAAFQNIIEQLGKLK